MESRREIEVKKVITASYRKLLSGNDCEKSSLCCNLWFPMAIQMKCEGMNNKGYTQIYTQWAVGKSPGHG